jgi:hypothetical protein
MMMNAHRFQSLLSLLFILTICKDVTSSSSGSTPVAPKSLSSNASLTDYGVDVSFPMQHNGVSTNYPWLPHNVDPKVQTPRAYQDMVIQPLGNRQKFYDDFLQGCIDAFGGSGAARCRTNELDRIEMSIRQPQSMQVRTILTATDKSVFLFFYALFTLFG